MKSERSMSSRELILNLWLFYMIMALGSWAIVIYARTLDFPFSLNWLWAVHKLLMNRVVFIIVNVGLGFVFAVSGRRMALSRRAVND